jgi:hypothetical protein
MKANTKPKTKRAKKFNNIMKALTANKPDSMEEILVEDLFTKHGKLCERKGDLRTIKRRFNDRRERLKVTFDEIMNYKGTLIESVINNYEQAKEISPAHYAAMIIGSRTFVKTWVEYFISEIIPSLSLNEKDYQIMKLLIATKDKMSSSDFDILLNIALKDMAPRTAILVSYYFPEKLKETHQRVIDEYLGKFNNDSEIMEDVISKFQDSTKTFFNDMSSLLQPAKE